MLKYLEKENLLKADRPRAINQSIYLEQAVNLFQNAAAALQENVEINMKAGLYKVPYSHLLEGGGVYQVCRGRISSCEEGKEGIVMAVGKNITLK